MASEVEDLENEISELKEENIFLKRLIRVIIDKIVANDGDPIFEHNQIIKRATNYNPDSDPLDLIDA